MQQDYKQKVRDFFNSRTAYDEEGSNHPNEAKRLLDYVPLTLGQSILDIATGTGLVAIPAAKAISNRGKAIGVDISPIMLAQAQGKITQESIGNLELIEADIESIDFNPEQFDVIFCCSALVYVSNIPAILDKCYRWLKPQGCFAFSTPERHSYYADLKVQLAQDLFGINLPHIIRPLWTSEKCRYLLQQSGFHSIGIEKHQYSRAKITKKTGLAKIEHELYPEGNPLVNLSETQKQLLQAEYQKAIDRLIAEGKEWQKNTNLYVKARK